MGSSLLPYLPAKCSAESEDQKENDQRPEISRWIVPFISNGEKADDQYRGGDDLTEELSHSGHELGWVRCEDYGRRMGSKVTAFEIIDGGLIIAIN